MAKVAVVAANGKAAKKIITEAVNRGFEVTAFGRRAENDTDAKNYIQKDIFDLTREDLKGYDAVVDAFGAWTAETLPLHSKGVATIVSRACKDNNWRICRPFLSDSTSNSLGRTFHQVN